MAKNLAVSGFHVSAWNRTPSKAAFLKEFEVEIEISAAEAVKNADVIISMLSDGDASHEMQNDEKLQRNFSSFCISWLASPSESIEMITSAFLTASAAEISISTSNSFRNAVFEGVLFQAET